MGHLFHFGWNHYPTAIDDLSGLQRKDRANTGTVPAFFKCTFTIEGTPCGTFIKPHNFKKGFSTINGFKIGCYYSEAGPQMSLYVPAPHFEGGIKRGHRF